MFSRNSRGRGWRLVEQNASWNRQDCRWELMAERDSCVAITDAVGARGFQTDGWHRRTFGRRVIALVLWTARSSSLYWIWENEQRPFCTEGPLATGFLYWFFGQRDLHHYTGHERTSKGLSVLNDLWPQGFCIGSLDSEIFITILDMRERAKVFLYWRTFGHMVFVLVLKSAITSSVWDNEQRSFCTEGPLAAGFLHWFCVQQELHYYLTWERTNEGLSALKDLWPQGFCIGSLDSENAITIMDLRERATASLVFETRGVLDVENR